MCTYKLVKLCFCLLGVISDFSTLSKRENKSHKFSELNWPTELVGIEELPDMQTLHSFSTLATLLLWHCTFPPIAMGLEKQYYNLQVRSSYLYLEHEIAFSIDSRPCFNNTISARPRQLLQADYHISNTVSSSQVRVVCLTHWERFE